jgi:putative ABC transport system substrate-binding protein
MVRRREFVAGLARGAALSPLVARAQQRAVPVIGFLNGGTESQVRLYTAAFLQGLGDQGYAEKYNVEILYRWADNQYDRLPAMAANLVRRRVAVIAAPGNTASALAAKAATATIPIVFATGGDPIKLGLVVSFNRPGGNLTGVSFLTTALAAKLIELLHEGVPAVASIGFLVNPTGPQTVADIREAETAARILGVHLIILHASTPSEIEASFAILVGQRSSGLVVQGDIFFFDQRVQLVTLAARHAVPAIYVAREFVDAGCLMSYGASVSTAFRLAGTYTGRILNEPGGRRATIDHRRSDNRRFGPG